MLHLVSWLISINILLHLWWFQFTFWGLSGPPSLTFLSLTPSAPSTWKLQRQLQLHSEWGWGFQKRRLVPKIIHRASLLPFHSEMSSPPTLVDYYIYDPMPKKAEFEIFKNSHSAFEKCSISRRVRYVLLRTQFCLHSDRDGRHVAGHGRARLRGLCSG